MDHLINRLYLKGIHLVMKSVIPCIDTIFYDTIHYSLFTVGGGKG